MTERLQRLGRGVQRRTSRFVIPSENASPARTEESLTILVRRISEHPAGEIPGFTADYRCSKLIYYEHCTDVRDAIAREKQLKKWSRSKKVALIATLNPRWIDLAPEVLGE